MDVIMTWRHHLGLDLFITCKNLLNSTGPIYPAADFSQIHRKHVNWKDRWSRTVTTSTSKTFVDLSEKDNSNHFSNIDLDHLGISGVHCHSYFSETPRCRVLNEILYVTTQSWLICWPCSLQWPFCAELCLDRNTSAPPTKPS